MELLHTFPLDEVEYEPHFGLPKVLILIIELSKING